jgi:hypothetical protein
MIPIKGVIPSSAALSLTTVLYGIQDSHIQQSAADFLFDNFERAVIPENFVLLIDQD